MNTLSRTLWTTTALLGMVLPAAAAAPPDAAPPTPAQAVAPQGLTPQQWQQMQGYMSSMRSQMSKLHQTTDPKQRQDLLREHLQTMQSAMGLMQSMGGGMMGHMMAGRPNGPMGRGPSGSGRMTDMMGMQNRMDMMQMMMQQMMEQMQGQMQGQTGRSR